MKVKVSRVQLFVTPWTIQSMGFSRILSILEWVAFPFSRGFFSTHGSNPGLPHCR